jgi:hypothetical protein
MKTISELERDISDNPSPKTYLINNILEKLKNLEEKTKSHWVLYWASPRSLNSDINIISNEDIELFRDMLYNRKYKDQLFLDITSSGGRIDAAESIINYISNKFENVQVVVPFLAKSAATLICLIAENIYMGAYSSLGSISPLVGDTGKDAVQVLGELNYYRNQYENTTTDVYNKLKTRIKKDNKDIEEVDEEAGNEIQKINDIDPVSIIKPILQSFLTPLLQMGFPIYEAENAIRWVREVGIKALKWSRKSDFEDDLDSIIDDLLMKNDINFHQRNISKEKARTIGLNIVDLDSKENKEFENEIMEMNNSIRILNSKFGIIKLVASSNGQFRIFTPTNISGIPPKIAGSANTPMLISPTQLFNPYTPISYLSEENQIDNKTPKKSKLKDLFWNYQLTKMAELWDNEEDEIWDTL